MNAPERLTRLWHRLMPRSTVGAIGLDFAAERMHMVQMQGGGARPAISALLSLDYGRDRDSVLGDPALLRALVRESRRSKGFHGRRVVTCLPHGETRLVALTYRQAPEQNATEALLRELKERVREPLDDWVVDYLPVRPDSMDGGERNAIVAMARREAVARYLDTLRCAGLEPVAIDIGPAALARLFSLPGVAQGYDNVLIVNFGRERSFLTVVWGRRMMLDREVAFGETGLADRLAGALGLDEATALDLIRRQGFHVPGKRDADGGEGELSQTITEILRGEFVGLAAEINRTLLYTASRTRGKSVDRVSLLGSVARHPGSDALLESLLAVPVDNYDPFEHFPPLAGVDTRRVAHSEIALATGLALRGLTPDDGD